MSCSDLNLQRFVDAHDGVTEATVGRSLGTSDIDEGKLEEEVSFLRTEIYLQDIEPRLQSLTAFNRFSVRE
jgi:hypothetical protein